MFDSRSTKTNNSQPLENLPTILLPTYPEKKGEIDLISTGFFQWTNRGLVSLALEGHANLPISPEELSHRLSEMFPGVSNEISEAI